MVRVDLPRVLHGLLVFVLAAGWGQAEERAWETVTTAGRPTARHEAAFVAYKGKAYLIGGRRINPVDVFDPETNTWTAKSETPLELHHFQAVVVDDAIYLIGAMTGKWPNETPLERIVVYYPEKDEFRFKHTIPEARRRGGAGAVLHDGKIYIVGGITNGHMDGYQPWLDVYDPKSGDWKVLDDAPHARDHFQAVVQGDRLYAVAGRTTSQRTKQGFDLTVPAVDVYDLKQQRWLASETFPALPTLRAGNMATVWGDEVIVGGGESGSKKQAHDELEALNTKTKEWRNWPRLERGRHGSGFAIIGDYVYTASGSGNRGGGPELTSIERLKLTTATSADDRSVRQWHTKTLSFHGPDSSEAATPNPFTDFRLLVTFTHPDVSYTVRGFYAADGKAAETSATSGNVWQVRFSPDRPGKWRFSASLRKGKDIAISDDEQAGEPVELTFSEGAFQVEPHDSSSGVAQADFRQRGRLIVDREYLRFGSGGRYFLKGGADSPENLLAYQDFDGTRRLSTETTDGEATASEQLHTYAPHLSDWRAGDPTWQSGKGKGLIGAINYLSSTGMNAVYFLTMNIGGDGKDVWPYAAEDDFTRFDCSKLDQWEIVFGHMQRQGILMHVVTQETENERLLDDGDTGRLRKLYYRELIARFAHHPALIWNLGEENGPADFSPHGQTSAQQKSMADYLKSSDPYQHPVVIHTHASVKGKDEVLPALLGHPTLDGLSFQVGKPESVHGEVIRWKEKARRAGHPWMICMDEIGPWHTGAVPDATDPGHDQLRRQVLWGSLMAGAAGVEWYFGAKHPHNDLTSEDWRQRAGLWKQTRHALDFFESHLPYWEMEPAENLVDPAEAICFAKRGTCYVIYVPAGTITHDHTLALNPRESSTVFDVRWYDPVAGGDLQSTSVRTISGAGHLHLGAPPKNTDRDWVVLVNRSANN